MRLGLGLGLHYRASSIAAPPPAIAPSASWDGTAGSGFATTPSDPTRTTAKPVAHFGEPDFQHIDDYKDVPIFAEALNGSTLTSGIDYARVRLEGETLDLTDRTLFTKNGKLYEAFWVRIKRPTSGTTSGEVALYAEIVPTDTTMQSRVIGPHYFTFTDTIFPFDVTVRADGAGDYTTLQAAFDAATADSAENARITITQGGTYEGVVVTGLSFTTDPRGRIYLEATEPVTIGFSSFTSDNGNEFDTRHPMWARGSNITFDMALITHFEHDNRPGRSHVFERVNFIDSAGGVWRKGPRSTPAITEQPAYFLECSVNGCYQPYREALLVRGGTTTGGAGDVFPEASCVVGHTVNGWNNNPFWNELDALTVTGPSGATLALSGGNNATGRVFTAKEGGSAISTFTVERDDTDFAANTNYTVENVVAWLNGLSGWTATAGDTTRRANLLGLPGQKGVAFGDTDVSNGLTLVTTVDIHSDMLAYNSVGENILVNGLSAHGMQSQLLFLTRTAGFKDFIIANVAAENGELHPNYADYISQFARSHSHVVVAHCTLSNQDIRFQVNQNYDADSYSAILNSAVSGILSTSAFDADLEIADCVIDAGETVPSTATGTVAAGTEASKFTDPSNGDFAPAGELLTNLKAPVVARDLAGNGRAASAPVGALA